MTTTTTKHIASGEPAVHVWRNNVTGEVRISKSAQTLLGLSPNHTRLYVGPISGYNPTTQG